MAKTELNQPLKILKEEFSSHLSNIAIGAKKLILERFDAEKDVDGNPFAKLQPATVRNRKGSANPILKRTSNLRNSIEVAPNFKSMNIKIDSLDYGHHLNDGRSNMKPRRIIEFPKEWIEGGSERENSFSETEARFSKRLKDFIDIYQNANKWGNIMTKKDIRKVEKIVEKVIHNIIDYPEGLSLQGYEGTSFNLAGLE